MSDGPVVSDAPAALKAARHRRAAAGAVEGAAASAWPAASLCVLWAAGASSGLLETFPGPARAAAFLLPLLLLAISLLRSIRPAPPATVLDAELEEDSDLPRGALSAAEDVLAFPVSPLGEALWARRIEAAAARARGLRAVLRPRLAAADPFGLRAIPILLLAVGLVAPPGPASGRLRTALDWSSPPPPAASAAGWIEPPEDLPSAAAELPPAALDPGRFPADPLLALPFLPRPVSPPALEIPEGARLSVVFKPSAPPSARPSPPPVLKTPAGDVAFVPSADGAWTASTPPLPRSGSQSGSDAPPQGAPPVRIEVLAEGANPLGWSVRVLDDAKPTASLEILGRDSRGRLKAALSAYDDRAVRSVGIAAFPAPSSASKAAALEGWSDRLSPDFVPISRRRLLGAELPKGASAGVRIEGWLDLSASPYAGSEVRLQPVATDSSGRTSESPPSAVQVPKRAFSSPGAASALRARDGLLALEEPDAALRATAGLAALSSDSSALFGKSQAAMGLAAASYEILGSISRPVPGVSAAARRAAAWDLLWRSALDLEIGRLGRAREAFSDAAAKAADAAASGSKDQGSAFQEAADALEELMKAALSEDGSQDGEDEGQDADGSETDGSRGEGASGGGQGSSGSLGFSGAGGSGAASASGEITPESAGKAVERAKAAFASGDAEGGRRILSALARELSSARRAPSKEWRAAAAARAARIEPLLRRQREIQDAGGSQDSAPPEEALAAETAEAAGTVGSASGVRGSKSLRAASAAMRSAAASARAGDKASSSKAADEAARSLEKALAAARKEASSGGQAQGVEGDPAPYPLVDGPGSGASTDSVGASPQEDPKSARARRLREEIRSREGEADRDPQERSYLRRLLDFERGAKRER